MLYCTVFPYLIDTKPTKAYTLIEDFATELREIRVNFRTIKEIIKEAHSVALALVYRGTFLRLRFKQKTLGYVRN